VCPTTTTVNGNVLIQVEGSETKCAVVKCGGELSGFKLLGCGLYDRSYNSGVLQNELSAIYFNASSSGRLLEVAYVVSSWIASILAVLSGDGLLLAGQVRIARIRARDTTSHVSTILSSNIVGVLETNLGG